MKIIYHKNFLKKYKKCSEKIKAKFKERLEIFKEDKNNLILKNHSLYGTLQKFRSINVTGDYRALYKERNDKLFEFIDIDTHSNLYK